MVLEDIYSESPPVVSKNRAMVSTSSINAPYICGPLSFCLPFDVSHMQQKWQLLSALIPAGNLMSSYRKEKMLQNVPIRLQFGAL